MLQRGGVHQLDIYRLLFSETVSFLQSLCGLWTTHDYGAAKVGSANNEHPWLAKTAIAANGDTPACVQMSHCVALISHRGLAWRNGTRQQ